ncbi:MAG: hypothetical protein AB4058_12490 [Microcystaceae cyanobacterium]
MISLREKICKECTNLDKLILKNNETILLIENRKNDIYFDSLISALTLYLGNFYMGVERIFALIAKEIDKTQPSGESWHIQLLKQMSLEIPSIRFAVISQETYEMLNEFRGFRHIARSLYAYDLEPQRVIELSKILNQCYNFLKADLEVFMNK